MGNFIVFFLLALQESKIVLHVSGNDIIALGVSNFISSDVTSSEVEFQLKEDEIFVARHDDYSREAFIIPNDHTSFKNLGTFSDKFFGKSKNPLAVTMMLENIFSSKQEENDIPSKSPENTSEKKETGTKLALEPQEKEKTILSGRRLEEEDEIGADEYADKDISIDLEGEEEAPKLDLSGLDSEKEAKQPEDEKEQASPEEQKGQEAQEAKEVAAEAQKDEESLPDPKLEEQTGNPFMQGMNIYVDISEVAAVVAIKSYKKHICYLVRMKKGGFNLVIVKMEMRLRRIASVFKMVEFVSGEKICRGLTFDQWAITTACYSKAEAGVQLCSLNVENSFDETAICTFLDLQYSFKEDEEKTPELLADMKMNLHTLTTPQGTNVVLFYISLSQLDYFSNRIFLIIKEKTLLIRVPIKNLNVERIELVSYDDETEVLSLFILHGPEVHNFYFIKSRHGIIDEHHLKQNSYLSSNLIDFFFRGSKLVTVDQNLTTDELLFSIFDYKKMSEKTFRIENAKSLVKFDMVDDFGVIEFVNNDFQNRLFVYDLSAERVVDSMKELEENQHWIIYTEEFSHFLCIIDFNESRAKSAFLSLFRLTSFKYVYFFLPGSYQTYRSYESVRKRLTRPSKFGFSNPMSAPKESGPLVIEKELESADPKKRPFLIKIFRKDEYLDLIKINVERLTVNYWIVKNYNAPNYPGTREVVMNLQVSSNNLKDSDLKVSSSSNGVSDLKIFITETFEIVQQGPQKPEFCSPFFLHSDDRKLLVICEDGRLIFSEKDVKETKSFFSNYSTVHLKNLDLSQIKEVKVFLSNFLLLLTKSNEILFFDVREVLVSKSFSFEREPIPFSDNCKFMNSGLICEEDEKYFMVIEINLRSKHIIFESVAKLEKSEIKHNVVFNSMFHYQTVYSLRYSKITDNFMFSSHNNGVSEFNIEYFPFKIKEDIRIFSPSQDFFVFLSETKPELKISVLRQMSFLEMPTGMLTDYEDFIGFEFCKYKVFFVVLYHTKTGKVNAALFRGTFRLSSRLLNVQEIDSKRCSKPQAFFRTLNHSYSVLEYFCLDQGSHLEDPPHRLRMIRYHLTGPKLSYKSSENQSLEFNVEVKGRNTRILVHQEEIQSRLAFESKPIHISRAIIGNHTDSKKSFFSFDLERHGCLSIKGDLKDIRLVGGDSDVVLAQRVQRHEHFDILSAPEPSIRVEDLMTNFGIYLDSAVSYFGAKFFHSSGVETSSTLDFCMNIEINFDSTPKQAGRSKGFALCRVSASRHYALTNLDEISFEISPNILSPEAEVRNPQAIVTRDVIHLVVSYKDSQFFEMIRIRHDNFDNFKVLYYRTFSLKLFDSIINMVFGYFLHYSEASDMLYLFGFYKDSNRIPFRGIRPNELDFTSSASGEIRIYYEIPIYYSFAKMSRLGERLLVHLIYMNNILELEITLQGMLFEYRIMDRYVNPFGFGLSVKQLCVNEDYLVVLNHPSNEFDNIFIYSRDGDLKTNEVFDTIIASGINNGTSSASSNPKERPEVSYFIDSMMLHRNSKGQNMIYVNVFKNASPGGNRYQYLQIQKYTINNLSLHFVPHKISYKKSLTFETVGYGNDVKTYHVSMINDEKERLVMFFSMLLLLITIFVVMLSVYIFLFTSMYMMRKANDDEQLRQREEEEDANRPSLARDRPNQGD